MKYLQEIPEFKLDDNWKKYLDVHGFCVVNLLSNDTVKKMNDDVNEIINLLDEKEIKNRFISLGRIEDPVIRNISSTSLKRFAESNLNKLFDSNKYDFISGVHLLKSPGDNSTLNPHQDSSLVDEKVYTSYYVWIPFQDVTENNGTLFVLPQSHLFTIFQRSLTVPWVFEKYENLLWNFMIPVPIKAGCVIIFHSALIHSSSPNKSDKLRIAANYFVKPKEADYLNYYSDNDSGYQKIEVYHVSTEFYLSHDILKKPDKKFPLLRVEQNCNSLKSKKKLGKSLLHVYMQYISKKVPLMLRYKLWKFSR